MPWPPTPSQLPPGDVIDRFYFGLLADYPNQFGGWTSDSANTNYTIDEVGTDAAFEQAARAGFDQLPIASGSTLRFAQVANTLASLFATENAIVAGPAFTSQGIIGVGIDELANRVDITIEAGAGEAPSSQPSTTPSNSVEQSLQATYGSGMLEFSSGTIPVAISGSR